ncbi:hypothetical protein UA08_07812 [Talaromyces atroroseus]|uniref:Carrier domain-containing protein n=1 Tax=Talaromyces atroroseus TaxID=1441469 RepID=A0A225AI45_TALAT|nr:hypothetical protein UA08_07812 [Talaromyces atroroseus]OKL56778.1 hypothetical protein UA08_07812 [Talaromyces atroroseus]
MDDSDVFDAYGGLQTQPGIQEDQHEQQLEHHRHVCQDSGIEGPTPAAASMSMRLSCDRCRLQKLKCTVPSGSTICAMRQSEVLGASGTPGLTSKSSSASLSTQSAYRSLSPDWNLDPLITGSAIIDDPFGMYSFVEQQNCCPEETYGTAGPEYDNGLDQFAWLQHSHALEDERLGRAGASPQQSSTNPVLLLAPADPSSQQININIYPHSNSYKEVSSSSSSSSQTSLQLTCLVSQIQSQLQELEEGCWQQWESRTNLDDHPDATTGLDPSSNGRPPSQSEAAVDTPTVRLITASYMCMMQIHSLVLDHFKRCLANIPGPNMKQGLEQIVWIDFHNPFACLRGRSVLLTSAAPLSRRQISQDDPAYVIYTSGSTGTPKGVITCHSNAIAYLRAWDSSSARLPIGPRLRWMIMSAPTFDIMLMDNFMPLLKGGTVCIAARQLLLSSPESIMHELRATATFTVGSLAMLLRPERLPTLDTILVGGEPMGQRIVDNFAQKPEATVAVTNHICHTDSRPSVLGAPLPGTRLVVLDETKFKENGQCVLAPLGVAGELEISSPQLSPGYLNRPKETARAFIHDIEFGPLYKTGDRVRIVWTGDGEPMIDYIGRITSDQVKLNGRRVELPEIEDVLSRAEVAAQVAVLVFKSRLVACVMPWAGDVKKDEAVIEAQCRANAERFLPTWMQPRQYLVMDRLPYSVNGKVDRRALEAIIAHNEESATTAVLPDQNSIQDSMTVDSSLRNGNTLHETTNDRLHDAPSIDVASAVHEALADALEDIDIQDSTVLADTGLDSLRSLVFLQNLEDHGIVELEIQDVLSAIHVDDIIKMIDERKRRAGSKKANTVLHEAANSHPAAATNDTAPVVHEAVYDTSLDTMIDGRQSGGIETWNLTNAIAARDPNNNEAHIVAATTSTTAITSTPSPLVDGIDVSKIAADDADEIFDLSVAAKLRHFDYHCRAPALAALGLESTQVEQVLPVTNVQTRFLALAIDPEYFDKTRLIGRPHVTHFPYALPSAMDPARFQRAVDAILPRYDCFRAVFTPAVHSLAPFAQVILSPSATKIPKVEIICDDADADAPESLWRETINGAQLAAEAAMSIDRPGITISWVWSQSRARCVFIMSLFHASYDGTQLQYMFDAVLAEYELPGCKPPVDVLPMRRAVELNLSYDWVSTVAFWARRVGGVPGSRLGSRQPNPKALLPGSRAGYNMTHMRSLSVKASMTMRQLSQAAVAMSNTMLTVVEAAWASVLAQTFTEQQRVNPLDIQFGTVLNGRRHQDSLRCMAPMVAALPLRLVVNNDGTQRRITNREVCALLATQRNEAQPFLQLPCPTLAHARMGTDRFDTLILLQALQPESSRQTLRELPGFNFDENMMAPYKEIDVGFPMVTELWPGSLRWDEKMFIRCAYSTSRLDFLNREWVLAALSALDEAIVRITSEPDAAFYTG